MRRMQRYLQNKARICIHLSWCQKRKERKINLKKNVTVQIQKKLLGTITLNYAPRKLSKMQSEFVCNTNSSMCYIMKWKKWKESLNSSVFFGLEISLSGFFDIFESCCRDFWSGNHNFIGIVDASQTCHTLITVNTAQNI